MEVKVIGQMDNTIDHTFESANRVYDKDGLAPTINTCGGGGLQPKVIVAMRGRNPDNPSDRTAGVHLEQRLEPNSEGLCNTLSTVTKDNLVLVKQVTKKGYIECELGGVLDLKYPTSDTRRGRVSGRGQICPTLMATEDSAYRIEPQLLGGLGEKTSNGGTQYYQQDRVYSSDGVSMAHPAQIPGGSYRYMDKQYRIRKLTPIECWRLMSFTDDEFHKAEKVNSNTQLYKQAGNSIVVDVLAAIFNKIFKEGEMEKQDIKVEVTKTDKMIDLAAFAESEPELFEELIADYPCEKAVYVYDAR